MTFPSEFRAAILAAHDDDTPRLVLADWLDEHDQPERAEFIRVQVEVARLKLLPKGELCHDLSEWVNSRRYRCKEGCPLCRLLRLQRRELHLLGAPTGNGPIPPQARPEWALDPETRSCWPWDVGGWVWSRGFVREVRLPRLVFTSSAATLFGAQPIEHVVLTCRRPAVSSNLRRIGQPRPRPVIVSYGWFRSDLDRGTCDLPWELWDRLEGGRPDTGRDPPGRLYDTPDLANAALSAACLLWARGR